MTLEGLNVSQMIGEEPDSIVAIEQTLERQDTVVCCDGIPGGTVADLEIDGDRLTGFVVEVAGRPVRVPIGAVTRARRGRVDLMLGQADLALLSTATSESLSGECQTR